MGLSLFIASPPSDSVGKPLPTETREKAKREERMVTTNLIC
jgi:hypothetical protein